MAQNYIQEGDVIEVVLAGEKAPGAGIIVGDLFGVCLGGGKLNDVINVKVSGVFELPKKTTDNIAVGKRVYWDNTELEITVTAKSNFIAGIAIEAAGNTATTVKVGLAGYAGLVQPSGE